MAPRAGRPEQDRPWEHYAGWWQERFTEGADPEYTEQILPLVAAELRGGTRVLDVGTGEGQVARLVAGSVSAGSGSRRRPGSRAARIVVGVDPSVTQLREAQRRAGGP
ncbi:MAG: class I SAM-dependent methyltransferase, partial [Acidimicrobiales bacterium]|nr:class I SAM-dependent methyltransferase [Acidimicrobiales bacterium]